MVLNRMTNLRQYWSDTEEIRNGQMGTQQMEMVWSYTHLKRIITYPGVDLSDGFVGPLVK